MEIFKIGHYKRTFDHCKQTISTTCTKIKEIIRDFQNWPPKVDDHYKRIQLYQTRMEALSSVEANLLSKAGLAKLKVTKNSKMKNVFILMTCFCFFGKLILER